MPISCGHYAHCLYSPAQVPPNTSTSVRKEKFAIICDSSINSNCQLLYRSRNRSCMPTTHAQLNSCWCNRYEYNTQTMGKYKCGISWESLTSSSSFFENDNWWVQYPIIYVVLLCLNCCNSFSRYCAIVVQKRKSEDGRFAHSGDLPAYSNTLYVRMTPGKMEATLRVHRWHTRNVCVRLVNSLHKPYQALSSASMGNRAVNSAGKHWNFPAHEIAQ